MPIKKSKALDTFDGENMHWDVGSDGENMQCSNKSDGENMRLA